MEPWEVIESRYLLRRWWMDLRVDRVRLSSGEELEEFHVIESPDWAGVLCLTQHDKLVMVKQYRHGLRETTLELPAGVVEEGETPEEAARRELREETGYVAGQWTRLGSCAPEPSRHQQRAHFFVARNAYQDHPPQRDQTEELDVQLHPPDQVLAWADRGRILHASHRMAIFWAARLNLM